MKGEKAGRLVEKAGTDAALTLEGRVGYVKTNKKMKGPQNVDDILNGNIDNFLEKSLTL